MDFQWNKDIRCLACKEPRSPGTYKFMSIQWVRFLYQNKAVKSGPALISSINSIILSACSTQFNWAWLQLVVIFEFGIPELWIIFIKIIEYFMKSYKSEIIVHQFYQEKHRWRKCLYTPYLKSEYHMLY